MKRTIRTVAVFSIPALAVGLLLGLLMIVGPFSPRHLHAQAEGVRIGGLRLADNEESQAGDFILTLEQIAPPPADEHYELWMQSDAGDLLRLGEFAVDEGHVTFAGSTEENLLSNYSSALISLEPDNDADEAALSQVVLSSTLPGQLLTLTRQLLVGSAAGDPALFDSLQAQIAIAAEQNALLADGLEVDDFVDVRSRAEQLVNILDGENGDFFGDLDRDGEVQNAGDGVGVRGYLEQAQDSLLSVLEVVSTTEELSAQVEELMAALEESQLLVEQARDQAQKVFAADTKTESAAITASIDALFAVLTEALASTYTSTLGLATYSFHSTTATPSTEVVTEPDAPLRMGQLRLAGNEESRTGSYILELELMEPAPDEQHYELWMQSDAGELLRLGEFEADEGSVTYTGSIEEELLGEYNSAIISLEPDDDPDEAALTQMVLSSTLPAPFLALTRQLLVSSETSGPAIFDNLQAQIAVASEHAGLLVDSLILDDMGEVRRHAEHLVNILDGESGDFFGDLNRDGQAQNPGDGVGVRIYLEQAHDITLDIPSSITPTAALSTQTQQLLTIIEDGQPLVEAMRDRALEVFGITDELELLEAAKDLVQTSASLTTMQQQAHDTALSLVVYEFFAPSASSTSSTTPTVGPPLLPSVSRPVVNVTPPIATTAGETWTHPLEGVTYVFIAGGEVTLGADTEDLLRATENPQHTVEVGAFWMRQHEVTNAQYRLCVVQGACTIPNNHYWHETGGADPSAADGSSKFDEMNNQPVTDISWEQASAYARWAGGRLPTEAEWEYACQGDTEQEYAWGDADPTEELSNYAEDVGSTAAVGSYPDGASPFGLLDMSGNVWEWTSSLEQLYPYAAEDGREDLEANGNRIGRGGSFGFNENYLRCSTRAAFHPDWQIPHLGLRVVIEEAD